MDLWDEKGGMTVSNPASAQASYPKRHKLMAALLTFAILALGTPSFAKGDRAQSSEQVTVKRVELRMPIPYPTLRRSNSELCDGLSKTIRTGINGEKLCIYRVCIKDGKEIKRELVSSKILKKPVPEVIAIGNRGDLPSRGYFSGRNTLIMIATAYSPAASDNGGYSGGTATGIKVGHGVVAVDPKYIPLGTRLYIEGYGYAIAADTGRAIQGDRIDLGFKNRQEASNFGRRKVIVHILD